MLAHLRDLVAHKGHANAAYLRAIGEQAAAAGDPEILALFQHVLIANRFWLQTLLGLPFDLAVESRAAASFDALVARFAETHAAEAAWLDAATDADLARRLESPLVPGGGCSAAQALLQVCLHSHGHRVQCAGLLRRHGGTPPATDFVLWLATREVPTWPARRQLC